MLNYFNFLNQQGAVMLIGAKSSCNYHLILCFLHQIFLKEF
jgi:hypothetical protein